MASNKARKKYYWLKDGQTLPENGVLLEGVPALNEAKAIAQRWGGATQTVRLKVWESDVDPEDPTFEQKKDASQKTFWCVFSVTR
jgi:hypothetical protein